MEKEVTHGLWIVAMLVVYCYVSIPNYYTRRDHKWASRSNKWADFLGTSNIMLICLPPSDGITTQEWNKKIKGRAGHGDGRVNGQEE